MTYLPRTIERTLITASSQFKIVMLSGMRQVGKNTLLKHLAKDRRFLSLNKTDALEMALRAPNAFLKSNPPLLCIDEVQWAPSLFPALKNVVDESDGNGLYWLSGSQRLALWQAVGDKLPGRVASFDLMPFSIYERCGKGLEQNPYLPSFDMPRKLATLGEKETWRIIFEGGWPMAQGCSISQRDVYFSNLINLYIGNDVLQANTIEKRLAFRRFLTILAARSAMPLSYTDVAKSCGITQATVRNWLSVAEASGVIFLIPPYFGNPEKRMVKSPKLYMADTGLAAYLLDLQSPEELIRYFNSGAIFETFVVTEIMKSWIHNGKEPHFYFYRDSNQNEVDLLIHHAGRYWPIEVKSSFAPKRHAKSGIDSFRRTEPNCAMGAVISMTDSVGAFDENTVSHGIWMI